jgi:hypothetical protein
MAAALRSSRLAASARHPIIDPPIVVRHAAYLISIEMTPLVRASQAQRAPAPGLRPAAIAFRASGLASEQGVAGSWISRPHQVQSTALDPGRGVDHGIGGSSSDIIGTPLPWQ